MNRVILRVKWVESKKVGEYIVRVIVKWVHSKKKVGIDLKWREYRVRVRMGRVRVRVK